MHDLPANIMSKFYQSYLCTCADVELDPVAELAVREIISNLGLVVVGWYHSHPLFQPDPSVTDINNQQQYQTLMRDEKSGLEPFIGLIVSTYDVKLPSVESHHQWFHTRPYSDGTRGKKPVPIPMLLETNIGIYADINQSIDLFLENDQTDDLLSKLMNLSSNESATSNTVNNTNIMECEKEGNEKVIKCESGKNESNTNFNTGQTGRGANYDYIGDDNNDVDNNNDEDNDDNDNDDKAIEHEMNRNDKEDNTVGAAEEYSDRIMFSFHGAGGSEYLGQTDSHNNHQNIHEKIGVGADVENGKRKYKKKAVLVPDPNASERRSGRETKAPTLFIPEKEKKIAFIPTILPIDSQDSHTTQESVAIKPNKSSQLIKTLSKKIIRTCLQNDIVDKVPGRKKNIDKQIGSVDKWLKGGGEIIKEGPLLSIKQGIRTKKVINEPVSKEIIKIKQRGKGIQVVKSVENILESKKRHGPGARTSKTQPKVAGKLPSTVQKEVERSQPSSSSSSSSVKGGNKKKKFNMSAWLDDLERPTTATTTASSSSSSSSSLVGGKRKKTPNTSMWLDELEKPNPSPKKKDSKNKKVTTVSTSSLKNLKQNINLSRIEIIVNGDNQKLSKEEKSKINSIDKPGVKKKKKGVICIQEDQLCDEIVMQKVCAHANAHAHVVSVENEMRSDDESLSFLSLLQGDSDAAVRGRKLICSINPTHRCLVVGIVALGFYYSTHPRRMNLHLIWRDDVLKIDKVKGSITYWASKLNVSLFCQKRLIDDISDFLIASWQEGDKKIIIIPGRKEKKKRSNTDSVVSGPSHITKDGTVIRYKEDDGRDDEPKKKKKKKIFKK